jgi:Cytochrome c7 and related cytochrome c/Doubled CXXCH motif (Paired_CXXCH_1)
LLTSTHASTSSLRLWFGFVVTWAISVTCAVGCESPKDFDAAHQQVESSDCIACHRPDYEAAKTPLHMNLYPKQCGSCHDNARWAPARFQHPFPLDGQHALTACWQCHVGNPPVFAGTSKDCASCHAGKFESSTFPGHSSFQQTCRDCHSTSAWKPATGPHPEAKFPISTGVHQGYGCLDCHDSTRGVNSAANTNCVGCHDGVHERAVLDPIHQALGLSDYPTGVQAPNFCLSCHPSGSR